MNVEPLLAIPVDSVPVAVDVQILERKVVQEPERNDRRRKKNSIGELTTHVRSSRVPVGLPVRAGNSGLPLPGLTASDITCCDMTELRPSSNVYCRYSRQSSWNPLTRTFQDRQTFFP